MRLSELKPGDRFIRMSEADGKIQADLWTLVDDGITSGRFRVARNKYGDNTFTSDLEVIKVVDGL